MRVTPSHHTHHRGLTGAASASTIVVVVSGVSISVVVSWIHLILEYIIEEAVINVDIVLTRALIGIIIIVIIVSGRVRVV